MRNQYRHPRNRLSLQLSTSHLPLRQKEQRQQRIRQALKKKLAHLKLQATLACLRAVGLCLH